MNHLKSIAAGIVIAGSLGLAALGIGSGVANAAPSPVLSSAGWAQDRGWGHGPGGPWRPGGWERGGWRGPGWAPPPPDYGYGYGYGGPPCVTGPLGLLHICS
ncbi:hypothetical protein [Mycolicibacterium sp. P9-64]|uniref:hypothetical protein n=1 Tax=Mycolicibacterium sp. P9-64 TaxID=2024612 RepID=UPI0011EDAB4D|nr:hypothetical protein [Mycolicibacterium sp. P9-64]